MKLRPETGLTFDDVLLVPKRSGIRSRSDVDTRSELTPGVSLAVPVISANMDTVTESQMAIAMAQQGGIGILHRFMTAERQAEHVARVKRAESFVVEDPITILCDATVASARLKMVEADIGGLMVVDPENHLLGLVTTRDVLLAPDGSASVETVMTPRSRLVVASTGESLEAASQTLFKNRIEKLPLVDEQDRIAGLITAQDIIKIKEHPQATKDRKGRLRVGVALGVHPDDLDRAEACVSAGADVIVIDIAHGHSQHTIDMIRKLKERFPRVQVIAGNVATAEGVHDLAEAGANAVKVGVGSGSICTTRIVTGYGVPQLTAVMECAEVGRALSIPIISDGGIRNSGDMTKALAAGASTVMVGNLLAGTMESPGATIVRGAQQFKVVRGMASLTANVERRSLDNAGEMSNDEWGKVVPEGIEALIPYRGEVADILYQLVGGLRSGMSYAGATTIQELWDQAEFIRITSAGKRESGAHDVDVV